MAGPGPALLLAVLGAGAAALSLEPVVWHTGNRRFLAAGGYVLYPQIGDRLDLVCPAAAGGGAGGEGRGYEYYKLYLVGGAQARRCQLPPAPPLLLSCDRPRRELRFTLKFQEFSPSQRAPEFRRRRDYFIITTSDGTREGLENRQGGACASRAMRVTLRVGQRPGSSLEQEEAGPANQTSPLPGPGPTGGRALAGGAGGGAAALLALGGAGGPCGGGGGGGAPGNPTPPPGGGPCAPAPTAPPPPVPSATWPRPPPPLPPPTARSEEAPPPRDPPGWGIPPPPPPRLQAGRG